MSWYQNRDNVWLDLFDIASVSPEKGAIDVGSGNSFVVDLLAAKGFSPLYANDLSLTALEQIKKRGVDAGFAVQLHHGSVLALSLPDPVGLWHDRAVFHFLTSEEEQDQYKQSLLRNTSNDAIFILATFSPNGPDSCSGLNVKRWSSEQLSGFFAPEFELVKDFVRVHKTPFETQQEFTVCIFKRVS